jgi:hypothetical protein
MSPMERMLPTSVIDGRGPIPRGAGYSSSEVLLQTAVVAWLESELCDCNGQSLGWGAVSRMWGDVGRRLEGPTASLRLRKMMPFEMRRRSDTWRRTGFWSDRGTADSGTTSAGLTVALVDESRERRDTMWALEMVASSTSASDELVVETIE